MAQDPHGPVVVLATSRDDDLALAKSMLMSAGIPFYTKNEMIADLFGYARFGGQNRITGPIELLVAPRDADDAYEILKSLDRSDQTAAVSRDNKEERIQAAKQVVILATSQRSEFDSAKALLQAVGISCFVTTKVINRIVQVQLMVAQRDVDNAQAILSRRQEPSETGEDASESSVKPNASAEKPLSDAKGSGLWGSAPRAVRLIAVIIFVIAVMSWVSGPLLSALASSAPEPGYLSWKNGEQSATSGGEVQGMTISVAGTSCPDSYQKIEDKMDQTSVTVQDVIDMLSELSVSGGVDEITVTLPDSSDSLTVQEAIAQLSKMPPSRRIQIGSLSWASEY